MSKNKTHLSSELLVKTRKKYRRHNVTGAVLLGLLVLILYFAYVFLVAAYKGYGGDAPLDFVSKWTFLDKLPYFSVDISITEVFKGIAIKGDILYRLLVLVGAILLSVLISWIYGFAHGKKLNKKYQNKYLSTLVNESKKFDIDIVMPKQQKKSEIDKNLTETLKLVPAVDANLKSTLSMSSPVLSWDGSEMTYTYKDKTRNGFLMRTVLEQSKVDGFVQLRNYGKPIIGDYLGNPISKFGFADNNKLSRFVCYSTLDQAIYKVIDGRIAQEVFNLQHFLTSSIVITLAGNNLSVFVDGFKFNLTRPLKKKIDGDLINHQVEAIAALNQVFTKISESFSKDVVSPVEDMVATGLE